MDEEIVCNTPETLVEAYYSGELNDLYPMLVQAIEMIVEQKFEEAKFDHD